ncbi:MAG: energy transducer TonB [Flavobacterium sp.]
MKKNLLLFIALFAMQHILAQAPISVVKGMPIPFETVETQPSFPGGVNEFIKFVGKNFRAPEEEDSPSGILKVSFVIDTYGNVGEIKIIDDLGSGTADEAKRVLLTSPKWKPGSEGGKPVRVLFVLPITLRN